MVNMKLATFKNGQRIAALSKCMHSRTSASTYMCCRFLTFNANKEENGVKKEENANADEDTGDDDKGQAKKKPLEKNTVYRLFKILGQKSQDKQQREALRGVPEAVDNKDYFKKNSDYFRDHDRPAHRLYGMYYKLALSEMAAFHDRGFHAINHLMHPLIEEELPFLFSIIDGIFTRQILFDYTQYMSNREVTLNLDVGFLRDDAKGGREEKIDEKLSIFFPPIYQPRTYDQQYTIIHNVRDAIAEMKGNFFEFRGNSIVKQLFLEHYRQNLIQTDLQLLSNDILIIDGRVYLESLEVETVHFPTPQLVSIYDVDDAELNNEQQKVYLICVLAIKNSIVTLKRKQFDEHNIPPNIPLAAGSALLVDPNKYASILLWRKHNEPATFFINTYGEKLK